MRHPWLLRREQAALVIVDVQERLVRVLPHQEVWLPNILRLAQAARILGLPLLFTEQYPKGLGPTVPALQEVLQGALGFEKLTFSAWGVEEFREALRRRQIRQVLLTGAETHVCVEQTALDLLQAGYLVHVPADAVASRAKMNWELGLEKMRRAGAIITSTEMALFEMLEQAGTEEFKAVQALIK